MIAVAQKIKDSTEEGRFHWTVNAFYRAVAGDVFDAPNQWELVEGELWKKEPMNPPHALLVEDIADLLNERFRGRFWVRQEKPFHVADDGEPVPDVALVDLTARQARDRHPRPGEMRLVIEVADTSVQRDTTEKALLYAQAGIADYWVSAIRARELFIFRQPTSNGYREVLRLAEQDTIRPLAAPDVELSVVDLLPSAGQDAAGAVPEAD